MPEDRVAAAAVLDERLGDWRPLLERFADDRAPIHFRPRAETGALLRRLQAAGVRIGVFTDAPRELAELALAHVGAARRVEVVGTPRRRARGARRRRRRRALARRARGPTMSGMDADLSDRRFDVLLERLDRIGDELAKLNRRADNDENFLRLTRELASLNESLQALAYAALGQQAPQVRRRRTG